MLDFDNAARKETIDGWMSSRCPLMTFPNNGHAPRGGDWLVTRVGGGFDWREITIEATAGNFAGWFLDFENGMDEDPNGTGNLILTEPNNGRGPRGAVWRMGTFANGYGAISATAGRYNEWSIGFRDDATVEDVSGYQSIRNLVLIAPGARVPPTWGIDGAIINE
jgi:hypothetical protein